ncbi:MAG: ATP-dependent DNA helicase RecG, partial [Bacteroidetes bacterium]|nr:ATP-dependent DNA helicase RecG [Bacteroidota bacterium]
MQKAGVLDTEITYLQGVGPRRAELLRKELGISTFRDLLHYYPYKYVDRSRFYKVSEIESEMPVVQIRGTIDDYLYEGHTRAKRLTATLYDDTGSIKLVWFKGTKWIPGSFPAG